MQLWQMCTRDATRGSSFQYPRSDRRRCNHTAARPDHAGNQPFSILGRIGGDATLVDHPADETPAVFQYPRSDRRRCNFTHSHCDSGKYPFQYPRSDRRRCNALAELQKTQSLKLSVSSVGSEAMQRTINDEVRFYEEKLSVSSVGSEAMQQRGEVRPPARPGTFSILGRIGGDATSYSTTPVSVTRNFQYPRSDRRRCNQRSLTLVRRIVPLSVSSVGSEAMQRSLPTAPAERT